MQRQTLPQYTELTDCWETVWVALSLSCCFHLYHSKIGKFLCAFKSWLTGLERLCTVSLFKMEKSFTWYFKALKTFWKTGIQFLDLTFQAMHLCLTKADLASHVLQMIRVVWIVWNSFTACLPELQADSLFSYSTHIHEGVYTHVKCSKWYFFVLILVLTYLRALVSKEASLQYVVCICFSPGFVSAVLNTF